MAQQTNSPTVRRGSIDDQRRSLHSRRMAVADLDKILVFADSVILTL
jgi:hypothetical protein